MRSGFATEKSKKQPLFRDPEDVAHQHGAWVRDRRETFLQVLLGGRCCRNEFHAFAFRFRSNRHRMTDHHGRIDGCVLGRIRFDVRRDVKLWEVHFFRHSSRFRFFGLFFGFVLLRWGLLLRRFDFGALRLRRFRRRWFCGRFLLLRLRRLFFVAFVGRRFRFVRLCFGFRFVLFRVVRTRFFRHDEHCDTTMRNRNESGECNELQKQI